MLTKTADKNWKYLTSVGWFANKSRANQIFFGLLLFFTTMAALPILKTAGLPGFACSNCFVFLLIGLVFLFCTNAKQLRIDAMTMGFLPFVIVGCLSSILMALLISGTVGTLWGETPLSSIKESLMWIVFDVVIVFYVAFCYAHCDKTFLDRVLGLLVVFVIVVGGIQAGVSFGIPGFSTLFDLVDVGGWFSAFNNCGPERLTIVGSEPASMGRTLGLLCLPYCYSRATNGGGARYWAAFAALLVLAFMTKSTTVYVVVGFVLLGILLLHVRKRKSKTFYLVLALVGALIAFAALWLLVNGGTFEYAYFTETLQKVFGKTTSTENLSTVYRNSTVVNDIEIFKDYPILGVGGGNQGYFYAQNLPSWILMAGSYEVQNALAGGLGVLNGGSFLPSLFSGYGIVGCVLFGAWIVSCIKMAFANKERMGHYFDMYIVAMFACIPIAWMAEGFDGAPVALFLVFCMPALGEGQ